MLPHTIHRILDLQPFTLRGAATLALAAAALYWFAAQENDLVASMLGGGTVAAIALLLIIGAVQHLLLRRKLQAELLFDSENALSQREVPAGIALSGSSLLPFYTLRVQRFFEHPGAHSPSHLISGSEKAGEKRRLIDSVRFAHRGLWRAQRIRLTLGDVFGFLSFSWEKPIETTVEVSAPAIAIRPLPITASSSRSGDQLNLTHERTGDLYDIKAYDPSDGIHRILWKTFAKSGDLVVRRPEPAIIPEGEIAIYLIADKQDDDTAGALLNYLEQLEASSITVLFGVDGIADEASVPPAMRGRGYFSEPHEIRHAINLCVWSPLAGSGRGFAAYLDALQESNRFVHRVVVFAPARPGAWIDEVTNEAAERQIKLSFAFSPPAPAPVRRKEAGVLWPLARYRKRESGDPAAIARLVAGITSRGSEVIVCEPYEQVR